MSPAPGLIVAAPSSGSGKTTVTLGLLRHFKRVGARVASAKAGPDYIDPAFHAAASGRPCLNLDPWAMRGATIAAALAELSRDADTIICEGVMGLFDGPGSTADLAAMLGWPVVLVIDIARQSGSAAAVLRGFAAHRRDVKVAGVILNRAASDRHAALAEAAIAEALPRIKRLGWMKRDAALALPERHLGLVQAGEHAGLEAFLDAAADEAGKRIDAASLRDLARPASLPGGARASVPALPPPIPPLGQRIAVARDAAFSFAYPAVLEAWRGAGASVDFFSPLNDEAPDKGADAIYLPGGYPELYAGQLAAARKFSGGLRQAAGRGAAVYGECGGYMALGKGLIDRDGKRHEMAGLLPLESSFARPRLHLGYRRARLQADTPLGKAGTALRGHEFHYASVLDEGGGAALFALSDWAGRDIGPAGRVSGRVMGSFAHLIDRE